MKKIVAVLCPMPMEFNAVEQAFGRLGETLDYGFEEKRFSLDSCDVILARCGAGKTFAAAKTQKVIMTYAPEHLFVCGVAGAISRHLKVFDVVVPDKVIHGDVCFGASYCPTDVADSAKPLFEGNPAFRADGFVPDRLNSSFECGTLATLDRFAEEADKDFLEEKFNAVCIDMESAPVMQIATMNDIPVTIVRAISDNREHNLGDFETNAPKACDIAARALTELLKGV